MLNIYKKVLTKGLVSYMSEWQGFDFIWWGNDSKEAKDYGKFNLYSLFKPWKIKENDRKNESKDISLDNLYKLRDTNAEDTEKIKNMMITFVSSLWSLDLNNNQKLDENEVLNLTPDQKAKLKSIVDYLQSRKQATEKYTEVLRFLNNFTVLNLRTLKDWINENERVIKETRDKLHTEEWIIVKDWERWAFERLTDYNSDWKVNKSDEWTIFWNQLLSNMKIVESQIWEDKLIKNIISIINFWNAWKIIDSSIWSIQALNDAFVNSPKIINKFQENVKLLARWDIYLALKYWPTEGLKTFRK